MKKFLVTILSLVYLATTTGATLHTHYCMGKMFSVDLVKKEGCSKCGMKTSKDCCEDQFTVIKVNDDHQAASGVVNFAPLFAIVNKQYYIAEPALFNSGTKSHIHNNSPPNSSGVSLCILNCVFRL